LIERLVNRVERGLGDGLDDCDGVHGRSVAGRGTSRGLLPDWRLLGRRCLGGWRRLGGWRPGRRSGRRLWLGLGWLGRGGAA
jgi:hypothetical protein